MQIWLRALSTSKSYTTLVSTIFAVSSGKGKCGVAVVRVSGANASEAVMKMTKRKEPPKPRMAVLNKIYDPITSEEIDQGLVLWFPGPRSFTGEDSCEFQVHGGSAVIVAMLKALGKLNNFRHAEPGEFTKRAFHAGKFDLTEVEGLADLIHAETELQRRQALLQMGGTLSELYLSWRQIILKNVAHVEAYIDFSEDENIEDNVLDNVNSNIKQLMNEIQNHLADGRKGERLRDGVRTVIIGQPNVGKSSLLNFLCQRPAAIVTPIAGTTRDVIESSININGYPLVIADTAGLRNESKDEVELEGIKRAHVCASEADLIIFVIDAHKYIQQSHHHFQQYFKQYTKELNLELPQNCLIVLNKIDLLNENEVKQIRKIMSNNTNLEAISCSTKEGLDGFLDKLSQQLETLCANPSKENPTITQARHRQHVSDCLSSLNKYVTLISNNADTVLAAQQLRYALRHIGRITGHVSSEQILDVIFKHFCIGK